LPLPFQFSSFAFLLSQASAREAALLQQSSTEQDEKRKRQKQGKVRKPFLSGFRQRITLAEKMGLRLLAVLAFRGFWGGQAK
jgi:hypothetical protein